MTSTPEHDKTPQRLRLAIRRILPAAAIAGLLAGCADEAADPASDAIRQTVMAAEIPADLATGQSAYDATCAQCHGERALGTPQGPPLIDIIYEPSHHADMSFRIAAARGVRAHHWNFGDMPAQPNVTAAELDGIIAYVRYLQRTVGIE